MISTVDNHKTLIADTESMENLCQIADPVIGELTSENGGNVLIFPQSFGIHGDEIEKGHIFTVDKSSRMLFTNNIMGFVGYKDTSVAIRSRFANDDGKDYFLHYMLQKVFAINLFDLDFTSDERERVFDFLIFTFPHFLNKAMRQGMYKEYKTIRHNDSNLRGRIDIDRHIRYNVPFQGSVAYSTREFTFDNPVTELIRHTIEYIAKKDYGNNILSANTETADNVRLMRQATPLYARRHRQRVMSENIRPVVHPYFYEYRDLQRICMMILRHDELKYGNDDDKIHGILFDGAWLWEEYLNTILKEAHFIHPRNKTHENPLHVFQHPKAASRYPDFYHRNKNFVLDAKYKSYGNTDVSAVDRDDLHQVIAYMWMLRAHHGGFVFPLKEGEYTAEPRELSGYPGEIGMYGMKISHESNAFRQFCKKMQVEESNLKEKIHKANQF